MWGLAGGNYCNMNPIAQTWWVLYPFYGLKIEDENHGLESPMFDQFHVMSRLHLPNLAEDLKEPKWFSTANALGDGYDTLLAIRNVSGQEEIYESTKEDADFFGAVLAIATFSNVDIHYASSLFEKLTRPIAKNRLALSLASGRSSFASHMERTQLASVIFIENYLKYTRESLKDLLLSNDLGFGRILLDPNASLPGELGGRLRAATIIFDDSLRQRDYSLQVLGCLTVMETLFKRRDGYENFKERIRTALGTLFCRYQRLEDLIIARHNFVHEGKRIVNQGFTYDALLLALSCMVSYSNLAPHYYNHSHLIDSIDERTSDAQAQIDVGKEKISRIPRLKIWAVPKHIEEYVLAGGA